MFPNEAPLPLLSEIPYDIFGCLSSSNFKADSEIEIDNNFNLSSFPDIESSDFEVEDANCLFDDDEVNPYFETMSEYEFRLKIKEISIGTSFHPTGRNDEENLRNYLISFFEALPFSFLTPWDESTISYATRKELLLSLKDVQIFAEQLKVCMDKN